MNQPLYLIAGLGKTGLSVAKYLKKRHKDFIAFDTRSQSPGVSEFQAAFPETKLYLERLPQEVLATLTDVIASPGLSEETPCLQEAKNRGIPIYGDIECLAREISAPVIAITGTNGKSTVTTLVGEMAKIAGFRVAVAGNIGTPVLDRLDDGHAYDLWVLELSSFQLNLTTSLKPLVATCLNISPDHLDRHHSLEDYITAKQRVYKGARLGLWNREDICTKPRVSTGITCLSFGQDKATDNQWGFVTKEGQKYLARGEEALLPVDSLLIQGKHNWCNALAACALAEAAAIPRDCILKVLTTFTGLPHRSQWVRTLEGVTYINDSKGTNIGATISAINGIGTGTKGKILLIAGGQGKGADFSSLKPAVTGFVSQLILIGEDADKIQSALEQVVPVTRADSLISAVTLAKNKAQAGDIVLLSPACASLDQFRDFNHRGEVFVAAVNGL